MDIVADVVKDHALQLARAALVLILNMICPGLGMAVNFVIKIAEGVWALGELFVSWYDWFRDVKAGSIPDNAQCSWDRDCASEACGRTSSSSGKICCAPA